MEIHVLFIIREFEKLVIDYRNYVNFKENYIKK